jgi:protein-S-isoprenylcysteine O-methyltransferase Ste14
MPHVLWDISGTAMGLAVMTLYFLGWVIVLFATFLINHFHLFGLQQAFAYLQQQQSKQATFKTPLLYKLVRHPMMSGVLIALWAVPVMTAGRLLFNLLMTGYVFVGLYFEERNLADELGQSYRHYQKTTPAVVPRLGTINKAAMYEEPR